jgi:hypothetical protein
MIEIIGNKDYTVYYRCECGVAGRCMVKPLSEEGAIITNITCPVCRITERVKLIQRDRIGDVGEAVFSWACVIFNEVTDYELKENLDD